MLSNYLAEIWGISIVVFSFALLVKEAHLKRHFASAQDDDKLFCWGIVTFVIGLAMVLSHNTWVKNWQVVITIFGWASLLKGLAILFVPEIMKKWAKRFENAKFVPYALVVALIIGLALTYFGFTA